MAIKRVDYVTAQGDTRKGSLWRTSNVPGMFARRDKKDNTRATREHHERARKTREAKLALRAQQAELLQSIAREMGTTPAMLRAEQIWGE